MERIKKQLDFLIEIDKIKSILRESLTLNIRRENDAEHSWHMAMCALILKEHFIYKDFDFCKSLEMILIHDIVEIYADDTPIFSKFSQSVKYEKEKESAIKIFSILPEDQRHKLFNLWIEYEELETKEAKFTKGLDRFQGFMQNSTSEFHTWKKYQVTKEQVLKIMQPIKDYFPKIFNSIVLVEIEKHPFTIKV